MRRIFALACICTFIAFFPPSAHATSVCDADINKDATADLTDYNLLVSNFLKSPFDARTDITKDNSVDLSDYNAFVPFFLQHCTATSTPVGSPVAALRIEAESMQLSGPYAGVSSSPYPGITLYGNDDTGKVTVNFPTTASRYLVGIRGNSSTSSSAGVSLYVGTVRYAQLSFTSTTPTVLTKIIDLPEGTGAKEIRLMLETDNGSSDTIIDYIELTQQTITPLPSGVTGNRIETETMSYGGPYAGISDQQFLGMGLYGNGDYGEKVFSFPTIPGLYDISVRGFSTTGAPAGVSVLVDNTRKGRVTFSSTSPAIHTVSASLTSGSTAQMVKLLLETDDGSSDTIIDYVEFVYKGPVPTLPPAPTPPTTGAYSTGQYRNLFKELGKTDAQIQAKIDATWNKLFYGNDTTERVYYPVGTDMAYILDVGNGDVRSEGMSYGMMIAVQLNKKTEFDRLWKWAKTYMQHQSGARKDYFAWQLRTDGGIIDPNPASDGEEYFVTALLFASRRWGNGTGIFNYEVEAQRILDVMLHKETQNNGTPEGITNMFNPTNKLVVFTPIGNAATYSDPSYHLPGFYQLWALWDKDLADRQFWADAVTASRQHLKNSTHQTTGLTPNQSEFNGQPHAGYGQDFRYDAWRTALNVGMDYHWFAADPWQKTFADTLQSFFEKEGMETYGNQYTIAGQVITTDHSTGLVACNAVASLAATNARSWAFVQALWDAPVPHPVGSGIEKWRYYDGLLYFMSLLHVSGNFKIYK